MEVLSWLSISKRIPTIKYEGKGSDNPLAFKYYNPDEIVAASGWRTT